MFTKVFMLIFSSVSSFVLSSSLLLFLRDEVGQPNGPNSNSKAFMFSLIALRD